MSSVYGIVYSRHVGSPPPSGRKRFTRNTTCFPAISVYPRRGLPLRDCHGRVLDPRGPVRAVGEGVLEEPLVVPLRGVRPAEGAPGLLAGEGAVADPRGHLSTPSPRAATS